MRTRHFLAVSRRCCIRNSIKYLIVFGSLELISLFFAAYSEESVVFLVLCAVILAGFGWMLFATFRPYYLVKMTVRQMPPQARADLEREFAAAERVCGTLWLMDSYLFTADDGCQMLLGWAHISSIEFPPNFTIDTPQMVIRIRDAAGELQTLRIRLLRLREMTPERKQQILAKIAPQTPTEWYYSSEGT